MDLWTWIPLTFGLGIAVLGLCFAFLYACERI
jgi:hypothetical protein